MHLGIWEHRGLRRRAEGSRGEIRQVLGPGGRLASPAGAQSLGTKGPGSGSIYVKASHLWVERHKVKRDYTGHPLAQGQVWSTLKCDSVMRHSGVQARCRPRRLILRTLWLQPLSGAP